MTIQAQPETIFNDLYQQVCKAVKDRNSNEFNLKLLDREAGKLLRASRGDGLEIKAHLASIRGDDEECDRLYSVALRETGNYTGALLRYLALLAMRLRQGKLLEVYRAAGTAFKGDPQATRIVEGLLAAEGFIVSARKLSEELSKMGSFSAGVPGAESERATQLMNTDGYDDADFGAPVAFAKRFLESRNIEQRGVILAPSASDENGSTIFFQIQTDQSPEDAVRTEMELFEALEAKSFPLEAQGKIVLGLIGTRAVLV